MNADDTDKEQASSGSQQEQLQAIIKQLCDGINALPDETDKSVQTIMGTAQAFSGTTENSQTQQLIAAAKKVQTTLAGIPDMLTQYLGKDNENLKTLTEKVGQLADGAKALQDGYNSLVLPGIDQLLSGAKELTKNNKTIKSGATALETNGKTLTSGAGKLTSASKQLNSGTSQITSATSQLTSGANTLSANSSALNSGAGQLASGTQQLMSGTTTLSSGSAQVKSGIKSLADGAKKLSDGTKEFDEDGIQKLSDIVDDDLQDILDRLDAICSDDNAYRSFSGKQDDMDGNVKFVIETAAIDNDSNK